MELIYSPAVDDLIDMAYLMSSVLFILSLAGLSKQDSSRRGNILGACGMFLAVLMSLIAFRSFNTDTMVIVFFLCLLPGCAVGALLAGKVEMTMMPQLIAMLHSFVGLAAVFVGLANFIDEADELDVVHRIEIYLGVFIGALTVTGSWVAAGKLQGVVSGNPLMLFGKKNAGLRHWMNAGIILTCFILMILFGASHGYTGQAYLYVNMVLALIIGWHLVMSIGGADMPVVVSMLNSYSGWATAASGFLLNNDLLIITGALVGSSGAILSYIMCKAMNRSFISVILGGFGTADGAVIEKGPEEEAGVMKEVSVDAVAQYALNAKDIIIVPGYGMAVARCQSQLAAVVQNLRKLGKTVRFAIHPVAGRLPGHMNVLLAEAGVPYNIVLEMDEINEDFDETDLVLVVGANDTVNPASNDPGSAIYGMPVCKVWLSKKVVVLKRGKATGYAGIENPLFFYPNCEMLLGNADKTVSALLSKLSASDAQPAAAVAETKAVAVVEEKKVDKDDLSQYPAPQLIIGVPKEIGKDECRVAVVPEMVKEFYKLGFLVVMENGAGNAAGFTDEQYIKAGAQIDVCENVWGNSDVILKVREPILNTATNVHEVDLLNSSAVLCSFISPGLNPELLQRLAARQCFAVIGLDCVPRITRAQKLDVLSSTAALAGHRAVIEAAYRFNRFLAPQITAAGKYPPAKVLIIGAGVAGLAALGTAKSLGCIVRAFDTRHEVKEQVESLGGEFLEVSIKEDGTGVGGYAKVMSPEFIAAEMKLFADQAKEVDIIITTANIPGKRAPLLVKAEAVRLMRRGSIIVDMAAANGGNCELTHPGEVYTDPESGVVLIGYNDLPSRMAEQASILYCANLRNLVEEMGGRNFRVDLSNEIIGKSCVVFQGNVIWSPPSAAPPAPKPEEKKAEEKKAEPAKPAASTTSAATPAPKVPKPNAPSASKHKHHGGGDEPFIDVDQKAPDNPYKPVFFSIIIAGLMAGVGLGTPQNFHPQLFAFVLACIIGYHVIWSVTAALHTPLMSVTNAISGIIIIGSMWQLFSSHVTGAVVLGALGVIFASINIAGGFYVTYRMLKMFHK